MAEARTIATMPNISIKAKGEQHEMLGPNSIETYGLLSYLNLL